MCITTITLPKGTIIIINNIKYEIQLDMFLDAVEHNGNIEYLKEVK